MGAARRPQTARSRPGAQIPAARARTSRAATTDRARDPSRSTEEDEELIEQVQALAKRIGALEEALKDGATPEGGPTSEILAELSSRLANLQEKTVLATSAPPADDGPAFYDSCAKFAAEASRISRTGRLPFGSDYNKIALTGPGWST